MTKILIIHLRIQRVPLFVFQSKMDLSSLYLILKLLECPYKQRISLGRPSVPRNPFFVFVTSFLSATKANFIYSKVIEKLYSKVIEKLLILEVALIRFGY